MNNFQARWSVHNNTVSVWVEITDGKELGDPTANLYRLGDPAGDPYRSFSLEEVLDDDEKDEYTGSIDIEDADEIIRFVRVCTEFKGSNGSIDELCKPATKH